MITFIAPTEDFIKSSQTETTAIAIASNSPVSVTVKNNQGFAAGDYVIVKRLGTEQAHICLIDDIVGNETIVLHSLLHNLVVGDQITKIDFNQRKLYGCATKDGAYVYIETKDIAVDNPQGTSFTYNGTDYQWFKATYYNSRTETETDIKDAIATQADSLSHYCSIYDIREEAGFLDNNYIDDGRINALRLQAEAEVKASIGSVYALPLKAPNEVVRTITKLLAAGWLMYQEYGVEASGTSKDGTDKIKQARSMLDAIRTHTLKLFDENDVELERAPACVSGGTVDGYPDNTAPDDELAKFKINQQF